MPATVVPIETRRGYYALLRLALPGEPEHAIGVLLLDPAADRLYLRLRSHFDDLASPDDVEFLSHLHDDLQTQASGMGAERFLASLEDSLSHLLRISDREAVTVHSFQHTADRLFARHIEQPEILPFRTHLPLYSLRAAATRFGEDMQVEEEEWVRIPDDMRAADNLFVAHVVGRSMEPRIPDGSLNIFRAPVVGSRQNKIVLVELLGQLDSSARYTIKKYTSHKVHRGEDEWQHESIRLEPLNPEFQAFELEPEGLRVIAESDPDARLAARLRRELLDWYGRNSRDLPWRRTGDPYRIWLSEIMLQQTRAQAVIPYYDSFLRQFPTVEALAAASEDTVLTAWSGLGYYSRARNLRTAAQQIARSGAFPRDYEAIRELAGVGDYTAAAVASIAFRLPHAVLDGNVMRVLARLLNEPGEITSSATKARLKAEAHRLLDRRQPGHFNQAMMELGATVCVPRAPRCGECPVAAWCHGLRMGTAAELPVKLRKKEPVNIEAAVTIVTRAGRLLLWRRAAGEGRMAGFWELPDSSQLPGLRQSKSLGKFHHTITHHRYSYDVIVGELSHVPDPYRWITFARLRRLPLSTVTRKALRLSTELADSLK